MINCFYSNQREYFRLSRKAKKRSQRRFQMPKIEQLRTNNGQFIHCLLMLIDMRLKSVEISPCIRIGCHDGNRTLLINSLPTAVESCKMPTIVQSSKLNSKHNIRSRTSQLLPACDRYQYEIGETSNFNLQVKKVQAKQNAQRLSLGTKFDQLSKFESL